MQKYQVNSSDREELHVAHFQYFQTYQLINDGYEYQ